MKGCGKHRLLASLASLALLAGLGAAQAETKLPSSQSAQSASPPPAGRPAEAPAAEPRQTQAVPPTPPDQPAQGAEAKPKKKKKAAAPARETALSEDPNPVFQPETYEATAKAAERYAQIANAGGWPTISKPLNPGAKAKEVAALRQRLAAEGDLARDDAAKETWDPALTEAVKHFQFRYGLRQTGIVAGATLKAMNVPAEQRQKQLAASAQRLKDAHFPFGERYVVVNIPSAAVEAVEDGRTVHRYVAVVGDVEHRSPEISAKITTITINPTWTVPTSIIKNEIIPKMRKNPHYLAKAKIRILDGRGREINPAKIDWSTEKAASYTLRQDSGAHNSLGSIRITMPNKEAVYMHDTPSKRLFSSDYRFLSHGCVRVEGVYDLAAWLLEGVNGPRGHAWDKQALLQEIASGEREDIKLKKPVPVIWVYMTGWASADGTVHFRDDVYGIDGEREETTAQAAQQSTTR